MWLFSLKLCKLADSVNIQTLFRVSIYTYSVTRGVPVSEYYYSIRLLALYHTTLFIFLCKILYFIRKVFCGHS